MTVVSTLYLDTNIVVDNTWQEMMGRKQTNRRSMRSTKRRILYTSGNEADGRWVEKATAATASIQEGGYGYRQQLKWQPILQKEVDDDSDGMVEMDDDVEQITYSSSEEVDEDSDATIVMEDEDDEQETSLPGEETKMTSNVLGDGLRICNTVRMKEEIYM
jgi:hypothetical protein